MYEAEAGLVHLWTAALIHSPAEVEQMALALPADEQERAARFALPAPRQRFVAGRTLLRKVLARLLSVDPQSLRLEYGAQGKPFLPGAALHFNLSHSHQLLALALSHHRPVGVDLEWLRPVAQAAAIARSYFTPAEQQLLGAEESFFRLWTCKEALVKAAGTGISHSWSEVEVLPGSDGPVQVVRFEPGDGSWSVQSLTPAPGYIAAVAVPGQTLRVIQVQHVESDGSGGRA